MFNRRVVAPIIFSILFSISATADPGARSVLSELAKNVQSFTLDNGLRVVMHKRGDAPVFAGFIAVRVGGVDETNRYTGLAHMLEHMAFKGTSTIGTRDYGREKGLLDRVEAIMSENPDIRTLTPEKKSELERIEAELHKVWNGNEFNQLYENQGAQGLNAQTDKDDTVYFVNLPRRAFEFYCWIESSRISDAVMREFYKERDVVLEERRMRFEDDPNGHLYELILSTAFINHPYHNPVIGYEEDIRRLTATKAKELHDKFYVPGNMVLSLVGDVDAERDRPIIEKYFGKIKTSPVPSAPEVVEIEQNGERKVSLRADASSSVYLAYKKPQYPHPDDAPLGLMHQILAGGAVSPLYTELVRDKKIASAVSAFDAPGQKYPNLVIFNATAQGSHTNKEMIDGIESVIEKVKKRGVTEDEVKIAKRTIAMEYLGEMNSNESLAKMFAEDYLFFGKWDASIDWYDRVMAVTKEDVNRVMKQYLVSDKRTVGEIIKNASVRPVHGS